MPLYAMWVHGNNAVPQWPGGAGPEGTNGHRLTQVNRHAWTDITGFRQGPGVTFRAPGNDTNYFHFCIPTPVFAAGQQVYLDAVFVLYRTPGPEVALTEVFAFDGPNPIPLGMLPGPGSHGTHDGTRGRADIAVGFTKFPVQNQTAPPAIIWGLGISVGVAFNREAEITFTAAGADFFTEQAG